MADIKSQIQETQNIKQDKYQNIYAYIYHIQTEKKRQRENSFKKSSKQINKMLKEKDKYSRMLIRNYISKKK